MIERTQAIVLHSIPYNDRQEIVYLFTREWGKVGCLLSTSRSPRSGVKRSHLQPLTQLEVLIELKPDQTLGRLKESLVVYAYSDLGHHFSKRYLAIFLAEFLYKALREREPFPYFYDYSENAFQILDLSTQGFANFHLIYMIHLAEELGFKPHVETYHVGRRFHLETGEFISFTPSYGLLLTVELSEKLYRLLQSSYAQMADLALRHTDRSELVEVLLHYFRSHDHPIATLKSLEILKELSE
jgi:DNA repair protein RecO (recombination protein O)